MASLGQIVADAWEHSLRTSPDPFRDMWLLERLGGRRVSYRETLDAPEVNYLGQTIPRIERVKRNLRALGDPHLPATRLP